MSYLDSFCDLWGGTNSEAVHKVHEFFKTSFFQDIKPIKGAKEVLEKYIDRFEFHIVTSRQHLIEKETRQFIETHYPNIFKELHFGNHYALDSPDPDEDHHTKRSKPEMCEYIKAIALVDDSMSYAQQCSEKLGPKGFRVCLFGDYPWNRGDVPKYSERCNTWKEVDKFLNSLIIQQETRGVAKD